MAVRAASPLFSPGRSASSVDRKTHAFRAPMRLFQSALVEPLREWLSDDELFDCLSDDDPFDALSREEPFGFSESSCDPLVPRDRLEALSVL